jgi:hypothetical protein
MTQLESFHMWLWRTNAVRCSKGRQRGLGGPVKARQGWRLHGLSSDFSGTFGLSGLSSSYR